MAARWTELPAAFQERVQADIKAANKRRAENRPRGSRRPRRDLEHQEQVAFFRRIRDLARADARYAAPARRTFAIPNGGGRSKAEAGRLKAEGVTAGVSDVFVAWPAGGRCGLWIEMKSMTGYASREQKDWIAEGLELGYAGAVCRGADVAFEAWREYVDAAL